MIRRSQKINNLKTIMYKKKHSATIELILCYIMVIRTRKRNIIPCTSSGYQKKWRDYVLKVTEKGS